MTDLKARFLTLDAIRGIAALLVAIGHWTPLGQVYLAVDFFLVLSGFILAHRYLYGASTSWHEFLVARIARLYPLHLLALLAFALVTIVRFRSLPQYEDGTAWTFLLHLLLLQNVGIATSELTWNAPSWSISVELWVNLIFFAFVSRKTSTYLLLLVSLIVLVVLGFYGRSLAIALPNYLYVVNSGLLRGVCSFLLGVVAYRIYLKNYLELRVFGLRIFILGLSLALLLIPRPSLPWLDFAAPLVFTFCVAIFSVDHPAWRKLITPIAYLGTISYSIYLLHYPILYGVRYLKELTVGLHAKGWFVDLLFSTGGSFSFYMCLVLVVSHITYNWFELPCRIAINRRLQLRSKK